MKNGKTSSQDQQDQQRFPLLDSAAARLVIKRIQLEVLSSNPFITSIDGRDETEDLLPKICA